MERILRLRLLDNFLKLQTALIFMTRGTCTGGIASAQESEESNFSLNKQSGNRISLMKETLMVVPFIHFLAIYDSLLHVSLRDMTRRLCLCEGQVRYIAEKENDTVSRGKSVIGLETNI